MRARQALVEAARGAIVIAYHLLRDGTDYTDLGAQRFDRLDVTRLTRYHTHRLSQPGYTVTLTKTAA